MAGLNDEIKALRERLSAVSVENDQLRGVRDELLAAQTEQRDDPPPTVEHENTEDFRSRIADLQVYTDIYVCFYFIWSVCKVQFTVPWNGLEANFEYISIMYFMSNA